MKNIIKLALIAVAVVGLAGCASNNYKSNKPMAKRQGSMRATQSNTTASIGLKMQGNLLVANVVTNWDPNVNDSLVIAWTAPANNYCENSQFAITKAHSSNDQSWAYRTVVRGNQVCDGLWTAQVMNVNTGKVLATTTYNVTAQPAPVAPAAPATPAQGQAS